MPKYAKKHVGGGGRGAGRKPLSKVDRLQMGAKADLISYAMARAETDPDKAEEILAFFCDAVESNEVPDPRILEHVTKAFRAILDGANASDALGLPRRRGQRRGRTLQQIDERNFDLALAVARHMKTGVMRDDAFENVAAEENASTATVRRAYETFRRIVRELA